MSDLSITIASKDALPSAFVTFRGFEECIPRAAELGYKGIELALKYASEIKTSSLDSLLKSNGLRVSCISTGQVAAETGYSFTDVNQLNRKKLISIYSEFIDLASIYGQLVNIGRIRGSIQKDGREASIQRFTETVHDLCDYAATRNVTLILEPVNRYELNFINSLAEGAELLKLVNHPSLLLMPDVFHMNIEDVTIGGELEKYIEFIKYVHLADSNRLAPGWGHTDFADIFKNLKDVNYTGWFSVEVLPFPDPDSAARQAAKYLLPLLQN